MEIEPVRIERIPFVVEELRVLADLTIALVKLRQDGCAHLAIENVGPEIWSKLLQVTYPPPPMILRETEELRAAFSAPAEHTK